MDAVVSGHCEGVTMQTARTLGNKPIIAKIHIAKNQLRMEDSSYRALLTRVTGKDSCSDMNFNELEKVMREFERLGFAPTKKRAGKTKQADSAQASKIRALWLNLYHLGEIRDPSEEALAAYVQRMGKISALQWLTDRAANTVIKGLRGWLERTGHVFPDAEAIKNVGQVRMHGNIAYDDRYTTEGIANKIFIIRRQYEILGMNSVEAFRKAIFTKTELLDKTIEELGVEVRRLIS